MNNAIVNTFILISVLALPCFARTYLAVDDFNTESMTNKLDGNTGCWNCNPDDTQQFCDAAFDTDNRVGESGASLKLTYDIDTTQNYLPEYPHTAYNGYFTKLKGVDLGGFKYLIVHVRGDETQNYTRAVTVELKNNNQSDKFLLEGINGSWQRFAIPLWKFSKIGDWKAMQELVFTFDYTSTRKTGAIYIDSIYFAAQAVAPQTVALRVDGTSGITIDGKLDEWKKNRKAIKYIPSLHLENGEMKTRDELDAGASFMWDDTWLYFAAKVSGGQIFCRQSGEDIWKEDCVELYLNPDNAGLVWNDKKDFEIGFAPTGPDGKPQVWAWFQNENPGDNVMMAAEIFKEDGKTACIIESAVRWSYLGITPRKGREIGATVGVHKLQYRDYTEKKINWYYYPEEGKMRLGRLILK
ncbi:MAG: hypothetical protein A2219_04875 [Elusimicrobia bacterium RIFOXYA2_FULL_50_26]|nr:MAG: hypothetical protein A2219_04875 [Elusimicrobia bacterium RIFOXYA2_FULL_50_26]OGS23362.1 MAG: hypothetical protein A2314_08130 [Elusimicrobia bacterium RIFOXYB2_FULL_50_12]